MGLNHQPINDRLTISTNAPGSLTIVIPSHDDLDRRQATLTPEEADQLVLHALGMTKPEGLDPNAEEDYEAAMEAVRIWQATRAARESVRQREAERDQVLKEAGFRFPSVNQSPRVHYIVDKLIEARKAGQK